MIIDTASTELVLVDFDDTLVVTAPRFSAARLSLFQLLEDEGFDPAAIERVHHDEVDPVMRERHGFGPQRMGAAFLETYRVLCQRSGRSPEPNVAARCGDLGEAVAGTPPPVDGALDALERLAAALPTAVYTQSGDAVYQLGCVRDAGALAAVGEARVRVVAEKTAETLRKTIEHFGVTDPARCCMVGNSVRSDINPALELGAGAILVEIDEPWRHDVVAPIHDRFARVRTFSEAVDLLLSNGRAPGSGA